MRFEKAPVLSLTGDSANVVFLAQATIFTRVLLVETSKVQIMWFPRLALATLVSGLGCLLAAGIVSAQAPMGAIGFRNELKAPVVVQGVSVINGVVRRGPPILIPSGKVGWDNRLPPGIRFISVYDPNQPNIALIDKEAVPFQGRDIAFIILMDNGKIQLKRLTP